MFRTKFVDGAVEDLGYLQKHEQRYILSLLGEHLSLQPAVPTRRRKQLRPNELATWELRLGAFRVFYDIDEQDRIVWVKAIGRKEHNRLLIRGKEVLL